MESWSGVEWNLEGILEWNLEWNLECDFFSGGFLESIGCSTE